MKRLVLSELTSPEIADYLPSVELAIIPTGSHEQHGPNLTFATDADRSYETGKLLAERLFPRVLLCPCFNYGVSHHHMAFPGTITLREETFISMIIDIAVSLKQHGIQKILLVNAHGGNRPALGVAINKLKFELGLQVAWIGSGTDLSSDLMAKRKSSEITGHACEGEVSQSMYLAPWLVRKETLAKAELKDTLYKKRPWWGQVPWSFDEITENGALGDATKASVKLGEEITNLVLDRIEAFIREYFFEETITK